MGTLNIFKMKKIIYTFYILLISFIGNAQDEDKVVRYNFYKVNKGHEKSFENLMKTFIADKMKRAIEDGCRDVWVFRKVDPVSEMSNHITHITVDIYKKSEQPCKVNFYEPVDNMAPEINEELMNLHRSNRELVYSALLAEVAHFNKSNAPAKYSITNFMRVNDIPKYSKKHIESTKSIFEKYSNNQFWVSHPRLDPISFAENEWNYITVDGFKSKDDAMKPWSAPKKVSSESDKKYGTNSSMRVIRDRMESSLIMYLN